MHAECAKNAGSGLASRTQRAASAFITTAPLACPDAVELGPLPKTSTGKVQKYVLRGREWAGHDKRIGAT